MAYNINKTNGDLLTTVADETIVTDSCLLTLVGKNYVGYGDLLQNNMVHILENFASGTSQQPTTKAMTGQLWYDTDLGTLNVYNGANFVQIATTDGTDAYLPLNGSEAMTGLLTLSGLPTDDLHAATKFYVDSTAVSVDGSSTMTGSLTLSGAPTVDLHAATKKYVDDSIAGGGGDPTKVPLNGTVPMTGLLTLSGAPTADLHATTKLYVDDRVVSGGSF